MASQQAERAAELQDPEIRAELDRRVREEGETVVKSGGGGTTLDAQERLAEGELDRPRPPAIILFLLRPACRTCIPCVFLTTRARARACLLLLRGRAQEGRAEPHDRVRQGTRREGGRGARRARREAAPAG